MTKSEREALEKRAARVALHVDEIEQMVWFAVREVDRERRRVAADKRRLDKLQARITTAVIP